MYFDRRQLSAGCSLLPLESCLSLSLFHSLFDYLNARDSKTMARWGKGSDEQAAAAAAAAAALEAEAEEEKNK